MLAIQYREWAAYPPDLKALIEILVVDDGSPTSPAADVPRPEGLPPFCLFRFETDIPWHQHAARNLGADRATGYWVFLSDMDHVLPAASLRKLLENVADRYDVVYTFPRLDAPDLTPKLQNGKPHPHCNTFALRRSRFWDVGGYDEDLVGYGTDGYFRKRLWAKSLDVHLHDVPVVRYSRDVQPDASTRADRDAARRRRENERIIAEKAASGAGPTVLATPWVQVI